MGREIRRVPKSWEHPRDDRGYYLPLYDEEFETAANKWKAAFLAWEDGTHEYLQDHPEAKAEGEFWEWEDNPPDRESYRPKWTEEPTCFQVYENVSEGTPDSPVFETEEELVQWLIAEGHSEHAAREFVRARWAPSMMVMVSPDRSSVRVVENLAIYDLPKEQR